MADEPFFALAREPRLSPYATSAAGAWLWAADGMRLLWTNAAGAALLGAESPAALTSRSFAGHPLAEQIRQIAEALTATNGTRGETLAGFDAHAAPLSCQSSLLRAGENDAVLIVASEPMQPLLPLATRAERMFAASRAPLAVFSGVGALLYASPRVAEKLGAATTLAALDAGALMAQAIASGEATGQSAAGPLALARMGSGGATVLVATLLDLASDVPTEEPIRLAEPPPPPSPPPAPPPPPAPEVRPTLTIIPAAKNVVPFRAATPPPEKRPVLTPVERSAFSEIAATLGSTATAPAMPSDAAEREEPKPAEPEFAAPLPSAFAIGDAELGEAADTQARAILERLPVGILIHHGDTLIYANRAFLEWTGYGDVAALTEAGGLECLMVEPGQPLDRINGTGKTFTIATRSGDNLTCEGRLYTVPWNGATALMLVLVRTAADERQKNAGLALRAAESEARELKSVLDVAADGVIIVDRDGRVLALNRSANTLFGYAYHEMARRPFTDLLAPEHELSLRDDLALLVAHRETDQAREVTGRARGGALIPLVMTMGRVEGAEKFAIVLRDMRPWKRTEEDLVGAKAAAERASSAKSDFLAKISHEIRTPLNAIIGFSEVMMEERFGPIGNERYSGYIKDIHDSGGHLVSLINDLLDLSKIEAGKLELDFAHLDLNALVQQCVALMQPQANRGRVIIRSALAGGLPPVNADARSVRQIMLNLLSNSIKFTGAGGQVIVSTAASERGDVVLRVRDTGVGMSESEVETALEPFRQLAVSSRWGSGGTGLGLPLTKALAEANNARFAIKSEKDAGTLVEVTFARASAAAE